MQAVMTNVLQSPYCQFCVFEDDCTGKDKYDAREESKRICMWDNVPGPTYFEKPDCFQDADDLMIVEGDTNEVERTHSI